MAVITIRVDDAEKEWLQYMADFHGISLSALIKNYSIAQLEDEYDQQTIAIAKKHWHDSGSDTVPMADILAEFGHLS